MHKGFDLRRSLMQKGLDTERAIQATDPRSKRPRCGSERVSGNLVTRLPINRSGLVTGKAGSEQICDSCRSQAELKKVRKLNTRAPCDVPKVLPQPQQGVSETHHALYRKKLCITLNSKSFKWQMPLCMTSINLNIVAPRQPRASFDTRDNWHRQHPYASWKRTTRRSDILHGSGVGTEAPWQSRGTAPDRSSRSPRLAHPAKPPLPWEPRPETDLAGVHDATSSSRAGLRGKQPRSRGPPPRKSPLLSWLRGPKRLTTSANLSGSKMLRGICTARLPMSCPSHA